MKKELKSGILSADKSADRRPTVGEVNVIAVNYQLISAFVFSFSKIKFSNNAKFKQINLHILNLRI